MSETNKNRGVSAADPDFHGDAVQNLTELRALTEASLTDTREVYVEDELVPYYYDLEASSGDEAPDDQTGGTGFWKRLPTAAETPASIKTKYESNANTNEFSDAEETKLANIEAGARVGLDTKSDKEAASGFSGNPKKITVTLTTAFADANYSVSVIGDLAVRTWTIESILAGSFIINSNTNSPPSGDVFWIAIKHGES